MVKIYHFRALFLWRWWVVLRFLIKKVRVHPASLLNGNHSSFHFSPGVKIGSRSRLSAMPTGKIALGDGVWLSHDVEFETTNYIAIGAGTTVQRRVTVNGTVSIGRGCIIAPNVFVSSGTHPFRDIPGKTIREQERIIVERDGSLAVLDRPVVIGDDCWLGVNTVVCPGVTIGSGCVIGANSVVVKDIPPNTIVAGVPARIIGSRK